MTINHQTEAEHQPTSDGRNEEESARFADMRDALFLLRRRESAMRDLVSTHIAKGLASRESNQWTAARQLAEALDEANCNMDELIDRRLSDDGWDPRSAWKAVASAIPADDPWAPKPDITSSIPEPVRQVLTYRLAEMLLAPENSERQRQAQSLVFALKREGLDLSDAIRKRIGDMTLGSDPGDVPF